MIHPPSHLTGLLRTQQVGLPPPIGWQIVLLATAAIHPLADAMRGQVKSPFALPGYKAASLSIQRRAVNSRSHAPFVSMGNSVASGRPLVADATHVPAASVSVALGRNPTAALVNEARIVESHIAGHPGRAVQPGLGFGATVQWLLHVHQRALARPRA